MRRSEELKIETGTAMDGILPYLSDTPTTAEVARLITFLNEQGTFRFPQLANGLFSAAAASGGDFEVSGYRNVWVRDNMHIAHAHLVIGEPETATRTVSAIMQFFIKNRHRFDNVLLGHADPTDPMNRPHIRFNGSTLEELSERWAHAQNDALGIWLWLTVRLIESRHFQPDRAGWNVIADLVHFWRFIKFWQDEESGHWEENRKVAASSIGLATAGLRELRQLFAQSASVSSALATTDRPVESQLLDDLIAGGEQALQEILPAECRQDDPTKFRRYDSALLFLIQPVNLVDQSMGRRIVADVIENLAGEFGIRRYLGDSYWCANYKQLLSAETRTADFSDSLGSRDSLLKKGEEAQWCLFDPVISTIYGSWFEKSRDPADRRNQLHYLRRSLRQLTPPDSPFGPFRCPESYYLENGKYVPNDMTPLLWTQANLRVALQKLASTCD